MGLAAVIISIVAVATSLLIGMRALTLTRHSNTMPVLVELFGQHRSQRLADTRAFVYKDLGKFDLSEGLGGLPEDKQILIRELAWFYDNLGALVTHGVVDVAPISGYLGQSVTLVWEQMRPLVESERKRRSDSYDAERFQIYFENLYHLVQELPPAQARSSQRLWRLRRSST